MRPRHKGHPLCMTHVSRYCLPTKGEVPPVEVFCRSVLSTGFTGFLFEVTVPAFHCQHPKCQGCGMCWTVHWVAKYSLPRLQRHQVSVYDVWSSSSKRRPFCAWTECRGKWQRLHSHCSCQWKKSKVQGKVGWWDLCPYVYIDHLVILISERATTLEYPNSLLPCGFISFDFSGSALLHQVSFVKYTEDVCS